jgi:alkyl hydroperoxide reductase subunit F
MLREIGLILPERGAAEEGPYELLIIGAGPAGLTAAVYAARKRLKVLLVSRDLGGQPLLTSGIENYMGYQYITGPELMAKFHEQVRQFPIATAIGEEAVRLTPSSREEGFTVVTRSSRSFQGKAVIVATGKRPRELGVPGEKELLGRGVSYCAVCDAPLFAGREVAVIGGGNSALTAAIDLVKIASRVYLVSRSTEWKGEPILVERALGSEKLTPLQGYWVREIRGEQRVKGIRIESEEEGRSQELPVEGVFIEVGLIPNSELVRGVVELNDEGEIIVDCACRTSVPGIFAAGDVTTVPEKQIIVAAGEGAKAALSAYQYLLRMKGG